MLAWLGKVVVLLVEGVGLDSGTTVYRERKEYRNQNKQAIHGMYAIQSRMMAWHV